jgi:hypothetical protein
MRSIMLEPIEAIVPQGRDRWIMFYTEVEGHAKLMRIAVMASVTYNFFYKGILAFRNLHHGNYIATC